MSLNIIILNFFLFSFYFLLWLFFPSLEHHNLFSRILFSLTSLSVSLVIFGINFGMIVQWLFKKKYEFWEFLGIASLSALIIPPLMLTLEFSEFKTLFPALPLVNSFFVFVFLLSIFIFQKKARYYLNINIPEIKISEILKSNFVLFLLFYCGVIFFIVAAYYPLPDLDPYYWHNIFSKDFSSNKITDASAYRPLFSSLSYIFNQTSKVDLYAYFKYVIPFLSLLILIPANLFSQNFSSPLKRILIFLFPLINASAFLYLETPIPQAILTIILFYFLFFLAHSSFSGKKEFFYFGGLAIFISFFYHEAAILIFLFWFVSLLIFDGKKIVNKFKENRLALFLLIIIFATNFSLLKNQFVFFASFSKYLYNCFSNPMLNLKFPASYVNIDGNAMGWAGLPGIAKYYAYYVGLVFFIILLFFTTKLIKNSEFRIFLKEKIFKDRSLFPLVFCFSFFFLIAEVLPRFPGVAFLPERAWNFGGVFSAIFIVIIFIFLKNRNKIIYYALILAFLVNLGGAIYVNNQKKYLITQAQLDSAQWIIDNLPENRIIFSSGKDDKLLKVFSHSKTVSIPENSFFKSNALEKYFFSENGTDSLIKYFQPEYEKIVERIKQQANRLSDKNIYSNSKEIINYIDSISNDLEKIKDLSIPDEKLLREKYKFFIYYSKEDPRNPYRDRPYYKKNEIENDGFLFDKYPDKFERIYYDKNNEIVIWSIL